MNSGRRVVLATRNEHKVVELRRILLAADVSDVELVSLQAYPDAPEVAETGSSFEENALLKARTIAQVTGQVAIADDSGISVDALNGMPGILSARWSGDLPIEGSGRAARDDANLRLVLAQLADVPEERRGGAFVCAAALVAPSGEEFVVRGLLAGSVTTMPRGGNGFGYDPIFVPTGYDRTTAELSPAEKDAISHRGRAFRDLVGMVSRACGERRSTAG